MTRDPLTGVTPERLRVLIASLTPEPKRRPTHREKVEQARVRLAARDEAQARLRRIESARIGHEVYELPNVRRELDRRIGNAVADREIRARLRHEVPEPEPESPALRALARSDAERQHELAWGAQAPREGWMTDDDA